MFFNSLSFNVFNNQAKILSVSLTNLKIINEKLKENKHKFKKKNRKHKREIVIKRTDLGN